MRLTFNAIPLWLMKAYLVELGAAETEENVMTAAGWRAVVSKAEPFRLGSLTVGVTALDLSGDPAAIEVMLEKLHWKTLRGGG